MHNFILSVVFLLLTSGLYAQISYTGSIDKYAITLVTEASGNEVSGVYEYAHFNEPIKLKGKLLQNTLTLYERNSTGEHSAIFVFKNYDAKSRELTGSWTSPATHKQLIVTLHKDFEVNGDDPGVSTGELMQDTALKNIYFRQIISKEAGNGDASVTGIKLIEKKTGNVQQVLKVDCQVHGISSIAIDDYNFDGYKDFSVFESSYSGPNTSTLYFLYDPKTKQYFNSGFIGVSLEFDKQSKTITEVNQCCAGSTITKVVYTLVKNKMVVKEQHCYKWDEKKQDHVERPWKECN